MTDEPQDATHCTLCSSGLHRDEGLLPPVGGVGAACNACRKELESAALWAKVEQPVAEVMAAYQLREARRKSAELRVKIKDMQGDVCHIYGWVLFLGIVTIISVIANILALVASR